MMALPLYYPHCCSLQHYHLYALPDSGETHYHLRSCSCSKKLGSFPGSGARSSALCIIASNFNLYQVTLKRKENKQAEPLAASLAIVFLSIGSQNTAAKALSAKTYFIFLFTIFYNRFSKGLFYMHFSWIYLKGLRCLAL